MAVKSTSSAIVASTNPPREGYFGIADVGAVEFAQKRLARKTLTFAPVKARWVRLTYVDHWTEQVQYPVGFSFTTECEVYGEK